MLLNVIKCYYIHLHNQCVNPSQGMACCSVVATWFFQELQEVRSKLKRGASEAPGEALRLCACALQRILKSSKEMDCYFDVTWHF